jgi:DNA-binding GntR family transcriptional regulator
MARARHKAISETLGQEIAAGTYPVGSRLPTEMQLQQRFGASRHTVREALKTLSEQGLLARRPKVGTIVRADKPLPAYTHSVRDSGGLLEFADTTRLEIAYEGFVTANRQTAETLGQAEGSRWLRLAGVRRMNDRPGPLCWSEIYVPARLAQDRAALRAHVGPVYEWVMQAHGLRLGHVEQEVQAVALSAGLAPHLEAEAGAPALMVRRLYVAQDGTGFEVSLNLYPADRYAMQTVIRPRG